MKICAFTCVCEADACWVDQYLAESVRLGMPFVIHLDKCSDETRSKFVRHSNCVNYTSEKVSHFNETKKQRPFDVLVKEGFDWAMAWDVDETHTTDAPIVLPSLLAETADMINVRWLNLWESDDTVRTDGPFGSGHRTRFYNLRDGRTYKWNSPKVNGPRLYRNGQWMNSEGEDYRVARRHEFVVLHWGMMTARLREEHRARWNLIYGRHGGNPYGFWDYACDESVQPTVVSLEEYLRGG